MKTLLILLLFGVLAGTGVWVSNISRQNQEILEKSERLKSELVRTQSKLAAEDQLNHSEIQSEEADLAKLVQQTQELQASVTGGAQRLAERKNAAPGRTESTRIQDAINVRKHSIDDLTAQISLKKNQKDDLVLRGKQTSAIETENEKRVLMDLDARIRAQAELVKLTTQQISDNRKQKLSFEAQQRIPQLERELSQQRAALEELREQKTTASSNSSLDKSDTSIRYREAQIQADQGLRDLQAQLSSEKGLLQGLESDLKNEKSRSDSWQKETDSLEAIVNSQRSKLSLLNSQIQERKQKIQERKNQLKQVAQ